MADLAVKMLGEDRVGGYLVVFGDAATKDLQGDYFTKDTDFSLDWYEKRPALYHHGLDGNLKRVPIGVIDSVKADDVGIWAEAQLEIRSKYAKAVKKLVEQGILNWSSGSMVHLVEKDSDGFIKSWPIVEGSLTPAPAEPRMTDIEVIKSVYAEMGIEFSELSIDETVNADVKAASAKTDADVVDIDSSNNVNVDNEESEMSEQTQETQVEPQESPVTREELKALETSIANMIAGLKPEEKEAPPPVPVNAGQTVANKGVNIHPSPIGGGDDSDGVKSFLHYVKTGIPNKGLQAVKALEAGTDSEGGYIVPSPQHDVIIERRDLLSIIRVAPGFMRMTTTAGTYDIPVEGDDSAAMDATAEEAAATQNDPVFGNAAGVITKYTREIRYSDELEMDNSANFMGFIGSRMSREMAKAENAALHTALFAGGTAALTLDSNSTIGAAEIPEITGLIPASWENGAIWNMRKSTAAIIRGLQGNDFLFAPTPNASGGVNGSRYMLDGYPVYYNDQADAMGADNQVITFYNPEAVAVIDRQGLSVLVDPYTLASTGQVKLVYKFRFDVIVTQAQGVLEIICPS